MPEPVVVLSQRRAERAPEPLDAAEWTCAGLADQIPGAGDLLPVTLGERALHVRREPGGALSAAYNALQYGGCGSLPVQCLGGRKIVCPIRSCAFSLDGDALIAGGEASERAARQFTGFSPAKLMRVGVATWGPFILVNTTAGQERELEQQLATLSALAGPRVPALRCASWHTAPAVALWPEIASRLERFMRAPAQARSTLQVATGDVAGPADAGVYVAFANLMIGFAGDRALALILKPIGPLTSEVTVASFAAEGGSAAADGAPSPAAACDIWSALLGDLRPTGAGARARHTG
jgi:hypothetical protein